MRSTPSDHVFNAHGLYDVVLDVPVIRSAAPATITIPASDAYSTSEWIAGGAKLRPVDKYPLFCQAPEDVRFTFCPAHDQHSMARFRRQAQLLALGTIPTAPGPSSRYGRVKRVIAWWEDEHGLWFVVDEEPEEGSNLVEEWSNIMQDPDMEDVVDTTEVLPSNSERLTQVSPGDAKEIYASICELLVRVVQCLSALHDRHLSIISCKPASFSISRSSNGEIAILNRYTSILPLPTYNHHNLIKEAPFASSTLFQRDPIDPSESRIEETFLRKNLRYLAPEMAISKRVSTTGDIYSFGVLMFEMLTGATIDGGPDSPEEAEVDVLIDFHRHVTMKITPPLEWLQREASLGAMHPALPPRQLSDIVMRCLGKEADLRYSSLQSLIYDLSQLAKICRRDGDLDDFQIGQVDNLASFNLPARVICREQQLRKLEETLSEVVSGGKDATRTISTRILNVSGMSGSGKSRIVRQFVQDASASHAPHSVVIAWAKLEETIHPPLSSFTQIFTALLERFVADPREDVREWNARIRNTLGPRFQQFTSLIPTDYLRILGIDPESRVSQEADWSSLRGSFGSWSRQFLQLFATPEHPLIIVLDDIHWLPADEARYWRTLLEGSQRLDHTLIISTCRVSEHKTEPPSALLLSSATTNVHVPPLSEEGVHELLLVCFGHRLAGSKALASLLHTETGGMSLFVRAKVSTLVKECAITFDYEELTWRFDAVRLQTHLSKASVDAYLERLILSLSPTAQDLLFYVACLPRRGFHVDQLIQLLDKPLEEVEGLIKVCTSTATLLVDDHDGVRFTNDGPRSVAYNLIPQERAARIHFEISTFLRRPEYEEEFVYNAADHAIQARNLGSHQEDDESYVKLLMRAAGAPVVMANLVAHNQLVDAVEATIDKSGGMDTWLKEHRKLYLQFVELYAGIACSVQNFSRAEEKLDLVTPHLRNPRERMTFDTLRVRLFVAAGKMQDAVDLTFKVLESHGYNPHTPVDPLLLPSTPAEVDQIENSLQEIPSDPDDIRVLMMTLMASAGSSIYFSEPIKRRFVFALGLSLATQVKTIHETTAYFILAHSLCVDDVLLKKALVTLGRKVAHKCPMSYLIGHALTGISFQTFYWMPWTDLHDDYHAAIEGTIKDSNYEQSANALALHLATQVLSGNPIALDTAIRQYSAIRKYSMKPFKYLVKLPLQYQERISTYTSNLPWAFEGSIISDTDTASVKELPTHSAFRHVLALRLAVFYDAPMMTLEEIIASGRASAPGVSGLIYGTEWTFLTALVAIKGDKRPEEVAEALKILGENHSSPDFADRLLVLRTVRDFCFDVRSHLEQGEAAIDQLISRGQRALAGLLCYYLGKAILETTRSRRLATGFLRCAADQYRQVQMSGLCQMLKTKWPDICPSAPSARMSPSQALGISVSLEHPPLRRSSLSTSNETVMSHTSSGASPYEKSTERRQSNDQLDALALMRSSLALASEQDPPVLLCTLLRILCQFLRAEYAAIALCDDIDNNHVRLRAAGPFSRILPYDMRITDEAARDVCPTSLILHTARTGKSIISLSALDRFRADPFFEERTPRSLICIPILLQGKQKGVVMLSSMTIATTQGQWESAKEVVSTLATFATIITSNVSFTKRLKDEVDQRTVELSNALAAKTQFLSQCSHELRSPLSAVLGLAAVLEASSGLSDVQREHLRTIISSGEDLLGLINNILDHSRLESGSVSLESIPFTLRDVAEGALDSVAAVAQKKNLEVCLISGADSDPTGLIGDPFRIKQILLNLLSNAVKFTHEGRVTVKWRWRTVEDHKIEVEIDVEDTGIGIPASKMDKLFKSFSQIDESITRSFGGSGLGLIISKDLAKLLGGDCSAQSEYGSGSKFTFSFVADPDPNYHRHIRKLSVSKSCFVICDPGPWWTMLEQNLRFLHCDPVRFADDVNDCLVKGHPDGLNSDKQFDFIMVNTQMLDKTMIKRMKGLQPDAKLLYLVRSIDLAKTIRDFDITREAIISRPIKFTSLVRALTPPEAVSTSAPVIDSTDKGAKKVNRELAKLSPLKILLVDDNAVNVTVGRRILELFGYKKVISAGDGQQAIEAAEKEHYDLILLDLQMPVLDGFNAQERIRASPLAGNPCVVALTANADVATQQLCADAGFFSYLSKPLDIPRLQQVLGEVFNYRKEHRLITNKQDEAV